MDRLSLLFFPGSISTLSHLDKVLGIFRYIVFASSVEFSLYTHFLHPPPRSHPHQAINMDSSSEIFWVSVKFNIHHSLDVIGET